MNKKIQFAIFFSIVVIVYYLLNYYSITRITELFEIKNNWKIQTITILLTLSFFASTILTKYYNNSFVKRFYIVSSIWMGIVFLLFSTLIIYELINLIISTNKIISGILIASLTLILSVYSMIHNFRLDIKEIKIPIKNLKNELTIVQLSDIHIGAIHGEKLMKKIVNETNKIDPDLVVITGDWFDGSEHGDDEIFKIINSIKSPIYFITGNHELYEGDKEVYSIIKKTKVKLLMNEIKKIKGIQLIGINYSEDKNNLSRVLKSLKINNSKPSILLYHVPKEFKTAVKNNIDLTLSGHTHGGQIFPFNLIERIFSKYISGLYKEKDSYLYVSQGTGSWGPPMRLGTVAEITKIKLIK